MKASKYLSTAALAASLCFALPACKKGGDGDGENGGGGDPPAPSKADTHESLAGEAIGLMSEFADTLASAKDEATATTAAGKFDGIATKFEALAKRMQAIGEPSGEVKTKIEGMFDEQGAALEEKMGGVMATLLSNEKVGEILEPAMNTFQERMEALDPIMKSWAGEDEEEVPPPPPPGGPDSIPAIPDPPDPDPDLIPDPDPAPDLIPDPEPAPGIPDPEPAVE